MLIFSMIWFNKKKYMEMKQKFRIQSCGNVVSIIELYEYDLGGYEADKIYRFDKINQAVILILRDKKWLTKKVKGPIARILCDKTKFPSGYKKAKFTTIRNKPIDQDNVVLYPVLTIATNTDIQKPL